MFSVNIWNNCSFCSRLLLLFEIWVTWTLSVLKISTDVGGNFAPSTLLTARTSKLEEMISLSPATVSLAPSSSTTRMSLTTGHKALQKLKLQHDVCLSILWVAPVGRRREGKWVNLHQVADDVHGHMTHCLGHSGAIQKLLELCCQLSYLEHTLSYFLTKLENFHQRIQIEILDITKS